MHPYNSTTGIDLEFFSRSNVFRNGHPKDRNIIIIMIIIVRVIIRCGGGIVLVVVVAPTEANANAIPVPGLNAAA